MRQIANFHFNIKHSKPFDKVFQNLDKTVGEQSSKNVKNLNSVIPPDLSPRFL